MYMQYNLKLYFAGHLCKMYIIYDLKIFFSMPYGYNLGPISSPLDERINISLTLL